MPTLQIRGSGRDIEQLDCGAGEPGRIFAGVFVAAMDDNSVQALRLLTPEAHMEDKVSAKVMAELTGAQRS